MSNAICQPLPKIRMSQTRPLIHFPITVERSGRARFLVYSHVRHADMACPAARARYNCAHLTWGRDHSDVTPPSYALTGIVQ